MLLLKAFVVWLLILAFAVLNGALREAVLLPAFGKPAALVLSGILLSGLVVAISLAFVRWLGVARAFQAVAVGLFWLFLTLVFEFGFGRLIQHQTWRELFEAYTFKEGNVWPLVLLVVLFAPLFALRMRGPKHTASSRGA